LKGFRRLTVLTSTTVALGAMTMDVTVAKAEWTIATLGAQPGELDGRSVLLAIAMPVLAVVVAVSTPINAVLAMRNLRSPPGDVLMVCSDGLVEVDGEPVPVEELAAELEPEASAGEMVRRLLGRVSGRLADDATAVVLRRLAAVPAGVVEPAGERRRSAAARHGASLDDRFR